MGIDGRGNSVNFLQPWGSTASSMRSDHAYVSRAKLSCLPPSSQHRVAWSSTPRYKGLLLLRMWQGGRPVIVCSERQRSQRLRRRVEGDLEIACPWTTGVERPPLDTSASADRNVLQPL
jgi:hypothetical protein